MAESGDGELAGFCSLAISSGGRDDGGGGRPLRRSAALAELVEAGIEEVTLWVLPENRAALAFYETLNFEVEPGREKREERSGGVVIRMRRPLSTLPRSGRRESGR